MFFKKKKDDLEGSEGDSQNKEPICFPHCDPRIVHPPGECVYCDNSQLQFIRTVWNMNFTEKYQSKDKLPCPAIHFRGLDSINSWGGNLPKKEK